MTMQLNYLSVDEQGLLQSHVFNPKTGIHSSMVDATEYAVTEYEDYADLALGNPFDNMTSDEYFARSLCHHSGPVMSDSTDIFDEREIVFHAMDLDLNPLDIVNPLKSFPVPPPTPSGSSDIFAPFEEWIKTLVPDGLNVVGDMPCVPFEQAEEDRMMTMARQLSLGTHSHSGASSPSQSTSSIGINAGGHKQKLLWGKDGLLGLKEDIPPSNVRPKSGLIRGMTKKLKHQLADFVDESNKGFKRKSSFSAASSYAPGSSAAALATSLDSMVQAKLYSELEVMICNTANGFILQQYYEGRISQQSIDKVNAAWNAKNNHHVIEFRYDQATQRELISSNRRSLEFTGDSSRFPICLQTNLHNWKKIAHEMGIRTFCLPDCAIRKHLYDIRQIIDMMNPSLETLRALQDLSSWAHDQMLDKETAARRQSETRLKRGF